MSQDCPLTLVLCDFHMVSCQAHLARRDMPSHISKNLTGHVLLQQKMLIQLQTTVTSQQTELTQYKLENQQLREALEYVGDYYMHRNTAF